MKNNFLVKKGIAYILLIVALSLTACVSQKKKGEVSKLGKFWHNTTAHYNGWFNANELLDQEFGEEGTTSRNKFKEEAYTFYLSEILKSRRKELKLSQKELADKIGKQRPYISRVERGEDLRLSNFIQIATALGLNFNLTVN